MKWTKGETVTVERATARERRLTDLLLAGILGWNYPNYWMDSTNVQERIDQLLDATKDEVLPWAT